VNKKREGLECPLFGFEGEKGATKNWKKLSLISHPKSSPKGAPKPQKEKVLKRENMN